MYLAVEDRKSTYPFVGHVLSDKWKPYQESGSVNQPKENDVEKLSTVSKEGTWIKSIVEKASKFTKNDAETIQGRKDVQMEVHNASTEK